MVKKEYVLFILLLHSFGLNFSMDKEAKKECFICYDRRTLPLIATGCGNNHPGFFVHQACLESHLETHPKPACPVCRGAVHVEVVFPFGTARVTAQEAKELGASIWAIVQNGGGE